MSSSTTETQMEYTLLIIDALRQMNGSAKAASVKGWIATILGDKVPVATLPSGASKFSNDLQWARMYLVNAEMIEPVDKAGRGNWVLTPKGWKVPLTKESAQEIYELTSKKAQTGSEDSTAPDEDGKQGLLSKDWEIALLNTLRKMPPEGFERLCAQIMTKSGLEAQVTGRSCDGGIDGEGLLPVDEFRLVKMRVAWQCKRYREDAVVPSKDIRDFRGAMNGRAEYGIFFTTSAFSGESIKEAVRQGTTPIQLVDIESLIRLMGERSIGVLAATPATPDSRALDSEFFGQFLHPEKKATSLQSDLLSTF